MTTIKILNDYRSFPLWAYGEDGAVAGLPKVVREDSVLMELSERASQMIDSHYEFDVDDEACRFNLEKEKTEKYLMLDIVYEIICRLDEINDGSFTVVDCESERLKSL